MKFVLLLTTLAIGAYALNLEKVKPPARIVNGEEASATDFPYQVALFINGDGNVGIKCGGAFISELHVLTAAHCFDTSSDLIGVARLGANRYSEGIEMRFSIVNIHENYDRRTLANDIALVHLDFPVLPNGKTIKIIELENKPVKENVKVVVSGYGNVGDNVATEKLHYTELTTINNKECQDSSDNVLCAKDISGQGKATCQGDSGDPLVINWPNNPTHVGIMSFGSKTSSSKSSPIGFTRTADYIQWINYNMYQ